MKGKNSFTFSIMIIAIIMSVSIIGFVGCGGGGVTGITPNLSPTPTPNVIIQGKKYLGINAEPDTFVAGVDVTNGSSQLNSGSTQYTTSIGNDGYGTMEIDNFVEVIDLYLFNNEQEYLNQVQARFKTTQNIGTGANPNVTIVIPPNPTPPPTLPPPEPTTTPTPVPTVPPGPTNQAPYAPSNLSPSNGAANQPLSVDISAYYNDPEGTSGKISFYVAVSGQLIGSVNVNHGEKATVTWAGLSYSTTYAWYAVANDGEDDSPFSSTFDFTTRDEPTDPTPTPIPSTDPTIDEDSMRGGVIGKQSTIKGTGFGPNEPGATVVFNNTTNANVITWTDTLITYVVPSVGLTDANHVSCTITTSEGKSVTNNYFLTMSEPQPIYDTDVDGYKPIDLVLVGSKIHLTGSDNHVHTADWAGFTNKSSKDLVDGPTNILYVMTNSKFYFNLGTKAFSFLNDGFNDENKIEFGNDELGQARGMCESSDHTQILFADQSTIRFYNLDGTYDASSSFPFKYNTAVGIATDSDGNIFVGDNNTNTIVKYSSDGTYQTEWTRYGPSDLSIYKIDTYEYLVSNGVSASDFNKTSTQILDISSVNSSILVLEYEYSEGVGISGCFVRESDGTYVGMDSQNGGIYGSTL